MQNKNRLGRVWVHMPLAVVALLATVFLAVAGVTAIGEEQLDPARNTALPCELVSTPGSVPRSAMNIAHLANVCGFVGTDVEFQSRMADDGVRDYAFVGTMGAGLRIFDITDPAHPVSAGAYTDSGWQNDVQVGGNTAVVGFDPVGGANPSMSVCLQSMGATGGVDILDLTYSASKATYTATLRGCVANSPGGAHNSTLHPSGEWLALVSPRTHGTVDVVDLVGAGTPRLVYRIVGVNAPATVCPASASFTCLKAITGGNPAGSWTPHDVHFSADGATMYVAAIDDGTFLVDVGNVLGGVASIVSVIPNSTQPGGATNSHNIALSHQSDVTADGSMVVITDEQGGGTSNTSCNTNLNGVIGGMHFWAVQANEIGASSGATPASPKRIGAWFYPNPTLAVDLVGRAERACTIHVFRLGGNGTASPGPVRSGFDGVSSLPIRQTVSAHYGAGVWHIDFSRAPTSADGIAEDSRTTWGNTLGWNIMPGAETWSAKEYKGFIYAGDMGRGFDVYAFANCPNAISCVRPPIPNLPGKATGGGQIEGELAEITILRGTAVGGQAKFSFNAQFSTGIPTGQLNFTDQVSAKKVTSTSIDSFMVTGSKATFSGKAMVNGTTGISFWVEVEDFGNPGGSANPDTFRIVLGDGYGAAGVLVKGNIQVH
jgi:hypothetical protein